MVKIVVQKLPSFPFLVLITQTPEAGWQCLFLLKEKRKKNVKIK